MATALTFPSPSRAFIVQRCWKVLPRIFNPIQKPCAFSRFTMLIYPPSTFKKNLRNNKLKCAYGEITGKTREINAHAHFCRDRAL